MNATDLTGLLPHLSIACAAVAVAVLLAVRRSHLATVILTTLGLATAMVAASFGPAGGHRSVLGLLQVDGNSSLLIGLISAAGIAITLLSYDYWQSRTAAPEEFYLLLLLASLGATVLSSSSHFASTFLGLETLSVAMYGMIAYRRQDSLAIEAGLKYLVLAGVSSAFLLFGMALCYAELGSMAFSDLLASPARESALPTLIDVGLILMLVGFGFKLALVPFHLWTADVYQGASAPAAGFVSTVSKGAMFLLFVRLFRPLALASVPLANALLVLAIASMCAGNVLALRQHRVKRILGFSSIAHMGYLLVAFLSEPPWAVGVVIFYLVAYFLSMIAAFGVIGAMSPQRRDADSLRNFRGLVWRRPWLATLLTAAVFSLAGIPLTAGFLGKFQVLAAGVGAKLWLLVILLVLNSAVGLYYYLRIVVLMYQDVPRGVRDAAAARRTLVGRRHLSLASGATFSALALLIIWLGVYPGPLLALIRTLTLSGAS